MESCLVPFSLSYKFSPLANFDPARNQGYTGLKSSIYGALGLAEK